ncbi:tRNA modification GTPase [Aquimarina agarilytica]|uniref:tRNA modification GTPase n=1 Tax=Aquimarina agarilytica TaxID=1087449 RepID=UPI00028815F9|nr:tRNA modification GTPase [Aquimarina agarilytica]
MVEGGASLYLYEDKNVKRFFFKKQFSNEIKALVSKKYLTENNKIANNFQYKQQLLNSLTCSSITLKTIKNLLYTRNKLISLFDNYNTCSAPTTYVSSSKKQSKDVINITLRPRYNLSSFFIKNASFKTRNVDFGNKSSFGLGIEVEYILPFNKNKWSISIEPTYQEFSSTRNSLLKNTNFNVTNSINYKSIEIPLSLRHYL